MIEADLNLMANTSGSLTTIATRTANASLTADSSAPPPALAQAAAAESTLVKFYERGELNIAAREASMRAKGRCTRCWFNAQTDCACDQLPPRTFTRRVRFLVYTHPQDYYNAGDDGKLLRCAAPDMSEILVYGRASDDVKLREEVACGNTVLLFPCEGALEVTDLAAQGVWAPPCSDADANPEEDDLPPPLRVIVL